MQKTLFGCIFATCVLMAQAETTNFPSGVGITFHWTNTVAVGSSLVWQVQLTNASASNQTCRVTLDANALEPTGKFIGDVSTVFATNSLNAGAATNITLAVDPISYTNWLVKTRTYECSAFVSVDGLDERWISIGRTVMVTPNILSVSPTSPILQGHSLTGTVTYTNPLPVALHGVKVFMTADEGLSTNAAITECTWDIGVVAPGAAINVSTNYTAGQVGKHNISSVVTSDELKELEGSSQVEVVAD